MRASQTFICALLAVAPTTSATGGKELDPSDFRGSELFVFANALCYQIWPGGRLAQGLPGHGASHTECQEKWEEDLDLGNFDGSKSPQYGQHYSGGSRRGCSSWLKMFEDESLDAVVATITPEGDEGGTDCNTYITLTGPRASFGAKPAAEVAATHDHQGAQEALIGRAYLQPLSPAASVAEYDASDNLRGSGLAPPASSAPVAVLPFLAGGLVVAGVLAGLSVTGRCRGARDVPVPSEDKARPAAE
mmetsp:Transcript_60736/g.198868  ORF Transcript_60736/g.198868 Transcript_60736/m.198868 type:complete len:247 (-) Transcript_60736:115-855(-)|eukprot:CAMPEP_0203848486 /NCGR_PEP_ID=MMETSP0359-20131031/5622_1 /ASSEMBLY_ACC=CAM_ASM_000338 /TAXON_ID=268821 /ORGANISM="Scrippsiella Hangoei, Strain SHTV-5" /LENGTH=246 /DNA_ID=CAMNT_0050764085 /DNA_START=69 /DNA_END=809 /DNA_ORIENTATION=-